MKVEDFANVGKPPKVIRREKFGAVAREISVEDTKTDAFFQELAMENASPMEETTRPSHAKKKNQVKRNKDDSLPPKKLQDRYKTEESDLLKKQQAFLYRRR